MQAVGMVDDHVKDCFIDSNLMLKYFPLDKANVIVLGINPREYIVPPAKRTNYVLSDVNFFRSAQKKINFPETRSIGVNRAIYVPCIRKIPVCKTA